MLQAVYYMKPTNYVRKCKNSWVLFERSSCQTSFRSVRVEIIFVFLISVASVSFFSESWLQYHPLTPMCDPVHVRDLQRQSLGRFSLVPWANPDCNWSWVSCIAAWSFQACQGGRIERACSWLSEVLGRLPPLLIQGHDLTESVKSRSSMVVISGCHWRIPES